MTVLLDSPAAPDTLTLAALSPPPAPQATPEKEE